MDKEEHGTVAATAADAVADANGAVADALTQSAQQAAQAAQSAIANAEHIAAEAQRAAAEETARIAEGTVAAIESQEDRLARYGSAIEGMEAWRNESSSLLTETRERQAKIEQTLGEIQTSLAALLTPRVSQEPEAVKPQEQKPPQSEEGAAPKEAATSKKRKHRWI